MRRKCFKYLAHVAILVVAVVRLNNSDRGSSGLSHSLPPREATTEKQKHQSSSFPAVLSSQESAGVCKGNAIIYMAQKHHSSYGRNSFNLLKKSLSLLYQNYLNWQHNNDTNVFIFHTGDFNLDDVSELESTLDRKGLLHIVDLSNSTFWEVPEWLRAEDPSTWGAYPEFSVGYRHMIRWHTVKLWDFFHGLNNQHGCSYKFIMRMDEESFIHSNIEYNMFDMMTAKSYVYGFRNCAFEMQEVEGLWSKYARSQSITPQRQFFGKGLMCGFYNNFFIANLKFFLSPPVQGWLRFADQSGAIYRHRLGDLIFQTAAVYAFARTEQIHRFLDFTYEHFTLDPSGCPDFGVLATGYNDPQATVVVDKFLSELKAKRCPNRFDGTPRVEVRDLKPSELSPSYHHLHPTLLNVSLRTVRAGPVDFFRSRRRRFNSG